MFVHDVIREHIFKSLGMLRQKKPSLESLMKTEWSNTFEQLMRNRLIMGAIRYDLLHVPGKHKYDRINSIRDRLDLFDKDGNAEHLVDIANLCLLEFEEPNHTNFHFDAADDGIHTEVIRS